MFEHTEDDADKLVHDGTPDLKFGEFWSSGLDLLGPKFDGHARERLFCRAFSAFHLL
jgi:hypothetical protein